LSQLDSVSEVYGLTQHIDLLKLEAGFLSGCTPFQAYLVIFFITGVACIQQLCLKFNT